MADSVEILSTLKLVYTIYALLAISLLGWYGYRTMQNGELKQTLKPLYFWSYTAKREWKIPLTLCI